MIPHGVEVFVGLEPIDLRWGFNRLAGIVADRLSRETRSGALFLFFGKRRDALKVLFRGKPVFEIKSLRELHMRPHTDAFFDWVELEHDKVRNQRGLVRTALGYAHRQRDPLTTFYDDGRLKLDNNSSERELRRIAVGRKNWLFVGSDEHAQAAGNLLTLIATARLHGLDPELYLRGLIRVACDRANLIAGDLRPQLGVHRPRALRDQLGWNRFGRLAEAGLEQMTHPFEAKQRHSIREDLGVLRQHAERLALARVDLGAAERRSSPIM